MDIELSYYYLTEDNLNNLIDVDYIFIFSMVIDGKIIIEDTYLKTNFVRISELEDMIGAEVLRGIFIFSEKDVVEEDIKAVDLPIVFVKYNNDKELKQFLFKAFKKRNIDNVLNCMCINKERLELLQIRQGILKGKLRENKNGNYVSEEINSRRLTNFVGRLTDIEDILRKILEFNNQILTVKGSGGIGKTTLVLKVALELSKRGYFEEGIHFIDCEFITDYEMFEQKIASCFDLDRSINFKEHLVWNFGMQNKLIILDNFESLLYIPEVNEVKKLVNFLCDFSKCIITSREWAGFEFEKKHELRSLTTDEANELFRKLYITKINKDEERMLREEILERLLNNNPLAIKIITKNIPKNIKMESLRDELKNAFFDTIQLGYKEIYNQDVDLNIERSDSLFHSINYSYVRLTIKEQLALEMLSLFPDGIHLDNFRSFFNSQEFKLDVNKITYKEIKALEDKSLVEMIGPMVKLQSIIGRFAEFNFEKRTLKEKKPYYKRAFQFNYFLLSLINSLQVLNGKKSLVIYDQNIGNLRKCLNYIVDTDVSEVEKFTYLEALQKPVGLIEISTKLINDIEKIKNHFNRREEQIYFQTCVCRLRYYKGEFVKAYKDLNDIVPFEEIGGLLKSKSNMSCQTGLTALSIYLYEGKDAEGLELLLDNWGSFNGDAISDVLFKLGYYKALSGIKRELKFMYLEALVNQKEITIDELNSYIRSLFKKAHLEKMQTTYIKAKHWKVNLEEVEELVVTNPYTMGLKKLMKAFVIEDEEKRILLYKSAIDDLQHIKYYYIEAIYLFAKYLKEIEFEEYKDWYDKGLKLAEGHSYRFLIHQFKCLEKENNIEYNEDDYPTTIIIEEKYIKEINKHIRESYKKSMDRFHDLTKV